MAATSLFRSRWCSVVFWGIVLLVSFSLMASWSSPNKPEVGKAVVAQDHLTFDVQRYFDMWDGPVKKFSAGSGPKKLLLVTKWRSGSTFLSDLFGQGPDCFYWFEPLRPFIPSFNYLATRVNPSIIECDFYKLPNETLLPLPANLTDPRVETIIQVMNCDVRHVDARVTDNSRAEAFHSPLAQNYSDCRKSGGEVMNCRHFLEEACRSSVINVAKTVRTPFYLVPRLLEAVPDLKVVYYTRDPRAMMHSRNNIQAEPRRKQAVPKAPKVQKANAQTTSDKVVKPVNEKEGKPTGQKQSKPVAKPVGNSDKIKTDARNLCLRMMEDHVTYLATDAAYPGRILHVVYEDIAFNPVEETTRMYRFMGMELPAAIETWIEENTQAEISDLSVMATRKNSTSTAIKWMTGLDPELITLITEQCAEILDVLGYPREV